MISMFTSMAWRLRKTLDDNAQTLVIDLKPDLRGINRFGPHQVNRGEQNNREEAGDHQPAPLDLVGVAHSFDDVARTGLAFGADHGGPFADAPGARPRD